MVLKGVMDKTPQKIEIRKYANLSQPWNLAFFENEIFHFFSSIICTKSTRMKNRPYWMVKKSPKIRKSPNNEGFRGTYLIPPFWEHPVEDKKCNSFLVQVQRIQNTTHWWVRKWCNRQQERGVPRLKCLKIEWRNSSCTVPYQIFGGSCVRCSYLDI